MKKSDLELEFETLKKDLHDKIVEYIKEVNTYQEDNLCFGVEMQFELSYRETTGFSSGIVYSGRDGFEKDADWLEIDKIIDKPKYYKTGCAVMINFDTEEILEDDEPFEDGSPAFHFVGRGSFRMIRESGKRTVFSAWEVPEEVCSDDKGSMLFFTIFSKFIDDKNPMIDYFNEKFDKLIELDKQIMDCE